VGLTGPADLFTILLGAANIFLGIAFFLKEEIPRNFGFITLVVSTVLYGMMAEIDHFTPDFTLSYFSIPALLSLSSGIFFASHQETRRDVRFMLLSGFLIALSVAHIVIDLSGVYNAFSIIAALLAIPAAIFFLRNN
jgi:peptidoglycan/LPS O-acetylase OafA/YrhL